MSANIRVPLSATPILGFCEAWIQSGGAAAGQVCFSSYAEMMVFAASLGYAMRKEGPLNKVRDFLEKPYPIDIEYFKRFESQLMLMQLAIDGSYDTLKDEARIVQIMESLADIGFQEMGSLLKSGDGVIYHTVLAKKLREYGMMLTK